MGLMGCLYWGNLHICGILASIKATQHGVEPDTGVASDSDMKIETSHSSLKLKNILGLVGETTYTIESEFYLYPFVHLRENDR